MISLPWRLRKLIQKSNAILTNHYLSNSVKSAFQAAKENNRMRILNTGILNDEQILLKINQINKLKKKKKSELYPDFIDF